MLFSEEAIIRNAIENHRVIRFCYDGNAQFIAVKPYALYVSKAGKTMLHSVCIIDNSQPIQGPAEQDFILSHISNIMLTEMGFTVDSKCSSQDLSSSLKVIASI